MQAGRETLSPFRTSYSWRPQDVRLLPSDDEGGVGGAGDHVDASGGVEEERVTDPGSPAFPDQFLNAWGKMSGEDRAAHYGYPFGTPVTQMNDTQKAGYYRAQAEKHEARNRASAVSADELRVLREKAARVDQLEYELGSDAEKAAADARTAAEKETRAAFVPRLVATELRAQLAARGITDSVRVKDICDTLASSTSLLTSQGDDVDPGKVTRKLDSLLGPGMGTRTGPSTSGLGDRTRTTFKPGEAGIAEAERRFGKQNTQDSRQGARA